jgi:hypothetical protein
MAGFLNGGCDRWGSLAAVADDIPTIRGSVMRRAILLVRDVDEWTAFAAKALRTVVLATF